MKTILHKISIYHRKKWFYLICKQYIFQFQVTFMKLLKACTNHASFHKTSKQLISLIMIISWSCPLIFPPCKISEKNPFSIPLLLKRPFQSNLHTSTNKEWHKQAFCPGGMYILPLTITKRSCYGWEACANSLYKADITLRLTPKRVQRHLT